MAAIIFPTSPTLNQQFTSGDRTWEWNGVSWSSKAAIITGAKGETGDRGPVGPIPIPTVIDKSSNYTLVSADKDSYIRSTSTAITITVPDCLANGESINFIQAGTGQVTFAGSGVTLNSAGALLKTAKQFAGATVTKLGGAYYLVGNLA